MLAEGSDLPREGDVLAGKYRIDAVLGMGGMGMVVSAKHEQLGQQVAIKFMLPTGSATRGPTSVERFLREARAAARIQSDHVVRIFDVGTLENGAPYMVMELLEGRDLAQVLERGGPIAVGDAVDYVLQACDAIARAHAMGIVHRDIKPSNLFLTSRSDGAPLVKVLDFGISKATIPGDLADGALTSTSAIMGSPLYMSPEQVRNAKLVDGRADIWSLGVVLHELLSGAPAFRADTLPSICAAIIADPPSPLSAVRPEVPLGLEAVVMRCLEKDATRRYESVGQLSDALASYASRARPLGLTPSSARSPSSAPAALTLASAVDESPSSRRTAVNAAGLLLPETFSTSSAPFSKSADSRGGPGATPGRNFPLLALSAVVTFAIVLVLAVNALKGQSRVESANAPDPAAPTSAPASPSRHSFTLFIDSSPSEIEVFEGKDRLGATPLQLSVDNDTAQKEPRKLTLRRLGFAPYSIVQGPSGENVRLYAAMMPEVAAPGTTSIALAPFGLSSATPNRSDRPALAAPSRSVVAPVPAPPANTSTLPVLPSADAPSHTNAGDIRLQR